MSEEATKKRMVILTPKQSYDLCNELRAALDEGRQWSTWRAVAEDLGARIGRPEISEHHVYQACKALGVERCEVHGRNKQQALNFDAQLAGRLDDLQSSVNDLLRRLAVVENRITVLNSQVNPAGFTAKWRPAPHPSGSLQ